MDHWSILYIHSSLYYKWQVCGVRVIFSDRENSLWLAAHDTMILLAQIIYDLVTDQLIDATWPVVSCPDPAFSWGKGSGDYWAVAWLCWLSSIDFEGTLFTCLHNVRLISLVYAHAWILFHWIFQNQDCCWLSTTKKLLNSHQTLFLVRGRGLDTRLLDQQRLRGRGGPIGSKGHDHVPIQA